MLKTDPLYPGRLVLSVTAIAEPQEARYDPLDFYTRTYLNQCPRRVMFSVNAMAQPQEARYGHLEFCTSTGLNQYPGPLLLSDSAMAQPQEARYDPLDYCTRTYLNQCTDTLFESLVKPAGYPMESHVTETEDRYILKLFRVQKKNGQIVSGKPVVLLQHGLLDSADNWVINGDTGSLAFVLANAGYDVWLSNSRGNKYSRLHTIFTPDDAVFWNYGYQEMGKFDIKANIDYILKVTNQAKLTYVGHSQGTSQMFAALGTKSSADYVNSKVKKFIALAPIVYLANSPSKFFQGLSKGNLFINAAKMLNFNEWFPWQCNQTSALSQFQQYLSTMPQFCNFLLSFADYNPTYDNINLMPLIAKHTPSGTSLRTLLHYQQSFIQNDKFHPTFSKYDFGEEENLVIYGSETPPEFDLSLINIPIRGFVGLEDTFSNPTDSNLLKAKLLSLNKDYKDYMYNDCGHMTFMWALNPYPMFQHIMGEIGAA